jgi:hypothetical protein
VVEATVVLQLLVDVSDLAPVDVCAQYVGVLERDVVASLEFAAEGLVAEFASFIKQIKSITYDDNPVEGVDFGEL